jgi:dTDP-glucose 4,6-dehydratase
MSLLVTGGAGFIGSNFVRRRRALHSAEKLVVLDALTYAGHRESLAGVAGIELVHGDVCDGALVEATLAEHAIESVVHFAAESHVDRSIRDAGVFVRTNVLGTATLLEKARAHGVTCFVHISTDEVYGHLGPGDPPFTEETPLAPRSPYSASKAGADHLVLASVVTHGFPARIVRCSNNYGPYQLPEKLIPLMIVNALADQPLPVYGDGSNVRDWIHVADGCAAIDAVLERGRDGEVYNVGGRCERANIDVVRAILGVLGKPESLVRHVADRPGHDWRYAMDATKIARELGWRPARSFDEGLRETIAWYRANEAWCRAVR